MTHLLDTNVCVAYLRGKSPLVRARFAAHAAADLAVCAVVVGELVVGAIRSQNPTAEQQRVDAFLAPYTSLPYDDTPARRYAVVRADLEARGVMIADNDIMIAAIALLHGLKVVTHNTKDFVRIPGLDLEDWELP
jgi:tRNA(fMet)-specific endonuclease VapC